MLQLSKSVTHGALPEAPSPLVQQLIIDYVPQIHTGSHTKTHNQPGCWITEDFNVKHVILVSELYFICSENSIKAFLKLENLSQFRVFVDEG